MFPVLLTLGGVKLFSYGLCVAAGIVLAVMYFEKMSLRTGLSSKVRETLPLVMIVSGFIGSRFFYIIQNYEYYRINPLGIVKVWEGGLVYYGGLALALIVTAIFLRLNKTDVFTAADTALPALSLAHAFGRLGCFMAGCCYGAPTLKPWGVIFRNEQSIAYPFELKIGFLPLHPTQLYEFTGNIVLFLVLHLTLLREKTRGTVFFLYFFLYGTLRIAVEYFRADDRGLTSFGFAITTVMFFIAGILSLVMLFVRREKRPYHDR